MNKEDKISEFLNLLRTDPIFFIENFCKVVHPTKGEVPFKLYDYQKRMIKAYEDYKDVVSLLPRQSGKTETTCAYLLWNAMYKKKQNILIAAHKFEHVGEIIKRIKFIYEGLPDALKIKLTRDGYNARSIKFTNGSTIQGITTTPTSGRGKSISILYIDEFAFVPPNMAKEFWASVRPTLATGGRCIITSTPNNDDDEFAQIWNAASDTIDEYGNERKDNLGRNQYYAFRAYWDEHPDRDKKWKQKEYHDIGDERWRREYECEFISFEDTLINPVFIADKLPKMIKQPINTTGQIRWYEEIKPNHIYIAALDPSVGTGDDYSAIQVFRLPGMVQVAEWRHNRTRVDGQVKILRDILIEIFDNLADNPAQRFEPEIYWTVENNQIGEAALIVIDDTGEENFPGTMVSEPRVVGNAKRYRKGFNTTNKKKVESAIKFKSMLEKEKMQIFSSALIREIKFFIAKGSSYQAKIGENDDLIMSTLLCVRCLQNLIQWEPELLENLKDCIVDEDIEPMPVFVI